MLVAVVTIPMLINTLGVERFGLLTLAWMVIGYFSLFDMGLGRSLTKLIAEKIGSGEEADIPSIVWTGMMLMSILGLLGAGVMFAISPWLITSIFNISHNLEDETLTAFYILAVSIPIVISSTGLRGILEAYQNFKVVNMVRLPVGILTFIGPLIVSQQSNSLADVVLVLFFIRLVSWFVYLFLFFNIHPQLRTILRPEREQVKRLLVFGGWMTISNISAPLLLYLGRIFIVVTISAEAVAYFVTPYEVIVKLLIIPSILVSSLFPMFSSLFQKEPYKVSLLYSKIIFYMAFTMFPFVSVMYFFAEEGLAWWINKDFAINGYEVAKILAIGVYINSFGHISQALIQSYGRPDLTAKLHLLELIMYIPYLWFLISLYGIKGAAFAWLIRVTISTLVLSYLARGCLSGAIVKT